MALLERLLADFDAALEWAFDTDDDVDEPPPTGPLPPAIEPGLT
ncbi:MAG: hypothetical protein ACSLFP_15930 [Acidimicrobiales bacterium]